MGGGASKPKDAGGSSGNKLEDAAMLSPKMKKAPTSLENIEKFLEAERNGTEFVRPVRPVGLLIDPCSEPTHQI